MTYERKASKTLHEKASHFMPDGDTRSVTYFEPYPVFMKSGSGSKITDVDGNTYIDFLNNYTSLILGHARPEVVAAVIEQVKRGTVFPAPTEEQVLLAETITGRVKSCEKIRFCNSGSEANIQIMRAARTFTKRKKIVKTYGGYHGSFDFENSIDIPFNDLEKAEKTIKENREDIACVIVEPILGRGMIPAQREFLHLLQEITEGYDILFVLDEVVTFRLDMGGAQSLYNVKPDLTTLGKVIGGGFPVGAFGGREDIMMQFSPRSGKIPHSGSFNGNPVTMTAGLETLKILDSHSIARLNEMGESLKKELNIILKDFNACTSGMGSLLHIHFAEEPALTEKEFERQEKKLFSRFHILMLLEGIYMAPRGMFNLSRPMGEKEMEAFMNSAEKVIPHIA